MSNRNVADAVPLPAALLAVSLFPFLLLAALHWPLLPPVEASDYAQYILHAKAIVEGRPYGDTGYLFTAFRPLVGPSLLPPGLPLTLAPLVALTGVHSSLLRLPLIVSALAFLYFVWRYLSARISPWVAAAAVAMTGVALETGYATLVVISDVGFCALVWATILVADREANGRWSNGRILAIAALGAGAMAYRVAGIALLPAALAFCLLNRRRIGTKTLLAPMSWIVMGLLVTRGQLGALMPVVLSSRVSSSFRRVVLSHVTSYRQSAFDALLYPFPIDTLNNIYHVLAVLVAVLGLLVFFRERWRSFLACATVAYSIMLLAVPVFDTRYAWPLFPLLAASFVLGCSRVVAFASSSREWRGAYRAVALALVLPVVACASTRAILRDEPPTFLGNEDVQALFHEVRRTMSPEADRVVFMNPRVFALETGIPSMALFYVDSSAIGMREMARARITYVITGDLGLYPRANASVVKTLQENASQFMLRYRNASFAVYQLRPSRDSTVNDRVGASTR